MQRRAVAVYVALFLLVGTAAGVLIATAESPELTFENPDYELSANDSFEVDGQEYTVADISETEEGGDDGDAVEIERSGQIEWEEVTEQSVTWENESVVERDDGEWRVRIEGEDPSAFTLVEVLDREAILANDPNADNETVERDGGEFVVVTDEGGESRLVPANEYFPAPAEQTYDEGGNIDYGDQTATVGEVTADGVTLVWEGPQTMTMDVSQEAEITLGNTDFIAYFPDGETLILSTDFEAYEAQLAVTDRLNQYGQGLWYVILISGLSSVLIVAAAFVPTRY